MFLPNTDRMSQVISIEGNIGAGKSTAMKLLRRMMCELQGSTQCSADGSGKGSGMSDSCGYGTPANIVFLDEPVDDWRVKKYHNGTESMLSLFYSDAKEYGFTFQVNAFTSRQEYFVKAAAQIPSKTIHCCQKEHECGCSHRSEHSSTTFISERSMISDKIFASVAHQSGNISEVEWDVYCNFYELVTRTLLEKQKVIIYVDVPAEKCYERLVKRARGEEAGIPLEYLKSLEAAHEVMLTSFPGKVIRVNWVDSEEDSDQRKSIIEDTIGQLGLLGLATVPSDINTNFSRAEYEELMQLYNEGKDQESLGGRSQRSCS